MSRETHLAPYHLGNPDPYWVEIGEIFEQNEFVQAISRFMLMLVVNPDSFQEEYEHLRQTVHKFNQRSIHEHTFVEQVVLCAVDDYFDRRGREYSWIYTEVAKLRKLFPTQLVTIQGSNQSTTANLQAFRDAYLDLCIVPTLPFAGCREICPDQRCLYRFANKDILDDSRLKAVELIESDIARRTQKADEYWRPLVATLEPYAARVLALEETTESDKVIACLGMQAVERMHQANRQLRSKFVQNLLETLVLRNRK